MSIDLIFDAASAKIDDTFGISVGRKNFKEAQDYIADFLTVAKQRGFIDSFQKIDKKDVGNSSATTFRINGILSVERYAASQRKSEGDFFINLKHTAARNEVSVEVTAQGTDKILKTLAESRNRQPLNHGPLRVYTSLQEEKAQEYFADIAEMLVYSAQYYRETHGKRTAQPKAEM